MNFCCFKCKTTSGQIFNPKFGTPMGSSCTWAIWLCFSYCTDAQLLTWLSYPRRVIYKLSFLMYKCLQGQAPVYLTRLCVPTSSVLGRSRLQSADDNQLVVPRTLTSTFGPRAFSTSGPAAWNASSSELRDPSISLDCLGIHWKRTCISVRPGSASPRAPL